ncbi:hypothetical protein SEA_ZAKAI_34 [Mycobacterium phage Zakai]|nr:hypothetical protein SEA_ZAKAI_34 [Mycobacterium phage Zakai]
MGLAALVLSGLAAPQAAAAPQDDYEFCTYVTGQTGRNVNCNMAVPIAQSRCAQLAGGTSWREILADDTNLLGDKALAVGILSGAVAYYCPEYESSIYASGSLGT